MSEIGRAYAPISIPFGFHNRQVPSCWTRLYGYSFRFFSKRELGIPEGFQSHVYGANENRERFLKSTTLSPSASSETNFWTRLISSTRASKFITQVHNTKHLLVQLLRHNTNNLRGFQYPQTSQRRVFTQPRVLCPSILNSRIIRPFLQLWHFHLKQTDLDLHILEQPILTEFFQEWLDVLIQIQENPVSEL